jgi:hypothetical protein
MKKKLLILLGCCCSILLHAQKTTTVNVNVAGKLAASLTKTQKDTITNLTLTGTIDARDFVTMRDSMPKLTKLDFHKTNIASYTGKAGTFDTIFNAKSIPPYAFAGHKQIRDVIVSDSIYFIGYSAFENCSKLVVVYIPGMVKIIEKNTFKGCSELENVFGNLSTFTNITTIKENAFENSNTSAISYFPLVTSIGTNAFRNCKKSKEIMLPSTIISIGDSAFAGCVFAESITVIPNYYSREYTKPILYSSNAIILNLKTIGKAAFLNCSSLTAISIPIGPTNIDESTFQNCTGLKSITLPPNIISISKNAFSGCSSLKSIKLPKSVISIGNTAFKDCAVFDSIVVKNTVPVDLTLVQNVFQNANQSNSKLYVPFGSKSAYQAANQWKNFTTIIELAQIKPSLECTAGNLKNILNKTQKDTITTLTLSGIIDARDFGTMRDSMPKLSALDLSQTTIVAYEGYGGTANFSYNSQTNSNDSAYTSYDANCIPDYAFYNGTHWAPILDTTLRSVILPEDIARIGYFAFAYTKLTSITIPAGDTIIGLSAFDHSNIANVTFTTGLKYIGFNAFAYTKLSSITLPNGLISLGDGAFANTQIASVIIPPSVQYFRGFDNTPISSITIPSTVTSLSGLTGTKITSITIPSSVTYLSGLGNTKISSITIPNSVTTIGDEAFELTQLTTISIPSSVTSIGDHAFAYCFKLKTVTISDSVKTIRSGAFYADTVLTIINLPINLNEIQQYTFYLCNSLKSITIPATVNQIDRSAFAECKSLNEIYLNNPVPVDLNNYNGGTSNPPNTQTIFKNVNKTSCILYVPLGSKVAYQTSPGWKDFTNIVEVKDVFINRSIITMFENESLSLGANVHTSNNQAISYKMKDAGIANVSNNGVLSSVKTGNSILYIMNSINNSVYDSTIVVVLPGMNINGAVVLRSLTQIEVTVDSDFPLYTKMENDFTITVPNTWDNYTVTAVLKSATNPNILLLQLDKKLPKNTTITLSFSNTNAETGISTVKSSFTLLTTGIEAFEMETNLYPNPAQSSITIEASDLQTIHIYNLEGQLVTTKNAEGNSVELSVEALPAGVYIAEIISKSQNEKRSFVKR